MVKCYYGKRCYESPDLKHLAKQYSRCFLGIISKSLNLSKQLGRGYEKVSHPLCSFSARQSAYDNTDKQPTMRAVAVLHRTFEICRF